MGHMVKILKDLHNNHTKISETLVCMMSYCQIRIPSQIQTKPTRWKKRPQKMPDMFWRLCTF